jgi:hypothetical protein
VLFEAAYARLCARSVIRGPLAEAVSDAPPLGLRRLVRFYTPLAMSPLLALLALPIGAAGMARMPESLPSLAAWPALSGFSFLLRSVGVAFNEVVVRHAGDNDGPRALGRFAWGAGLALVLVTLVFAATRLGTWWFGALSGLDKELTALATAALWWMAAMPLLSFLHSYYQGLLVHAHRTRGIGEAVAASLVTTAAVLQVGILTQALPGASMAFIALASGALAQAAWLAWRCARVRRGGAADVVVAGDAPVRLG